MSENKILNYKRHPPYGVFINIADDDAKANYQLVNINRNTADLNNNSYTNIILIIIFTILYISGTAKIYYGIENLNHNITCNISNKTNTFTPEIGSITFPVWLISLGCISIFTSTILLLVIRKDFLVRIMIILFLFVGCVAWLSWLLLGASFFFSCGDLFGNIIENVLYCISTTFDVLMLFCGICFSIANLCYRKNNRVW